MNRHLIAIGLLLSLIACRIPPWDSTPDQTPTPPPDWQGALDQFEGLRSRLSFPNHLEDPDANKTGDEFDVNEYFTVLPHLSPEPGYVLDYVYFYDGFAGWPIIYARPEQDQPYATFSEFEQAVGDPLGEVQLEYLDHIQVDGTPEGFFELVVLSLKGNQFYLSWHANYHDVMVICSQEAVEQVIEAADEFAGIPLTDGQRRQAMALDLEPQIEIGRETVQVQLVTFSKWGGFALETFIISRDFPHTILESESEELVPYDCGVMF
jgi:hypothetical protein